MNGLIGEIDSVSPDCGKPPYYIPSGLKDEQGCTASVSELFTYEDIVGGPSTRVLTASVEGNCSVDLEYSLTLE